MVEHTMISNKKRKKLIYSSIPLNPYITIKNWEYSCYSICMLNSSNVSKISLPKS